MIWYLFWKRTQTPHSLINALTANHNRSRMKPLIKFVAALWFCISVLFIARNLGLFDDTRNTVFKRFHDYGTNDTSLDDTNPSTGTIAMCVVVKDDVDILPWIDYHHALGVSKFYIFDHGSSPPLSQILNTHIDSSLVQYEYQPYYLANILRAVPFAKKINPQIELFQRCIEQHKSHHQWIAFLDADEYIVLRNHSQSLVQTLHKFQSYGGLVLNWQVFGSSGLDRTPDPHSVSAAFYRHFNACYPSIHTKSIVNTRYTIGASSNPHWFAYRQGFYAVNEEMTRPALLWGSDPPSFQTIWINHYSTKSRQDFARKIQRGRDSTTLSKHHAEWTYFDEINRKAINRCEVLEHPTVSRNKSRVAG